MDVPRFRRRAKSIRAIPALIEAHRGGGYGLRGGDMRRLMRQSVRPASMVGQLVGLLLLALGLSQAIGFFIYRDERTDALRGVVADEFISRARRRWRSFWRRRRPPSMSGRCAPSPRAIRATG